MARGVFAAASSMNTVRQARAMPSATAASPEANIRVRGIWYSGPLSTSGAAADSTLSSPGTNTSPHRKMVRPGAAQAAHLPGVEELRLSHRNEQVARLRLPVFQPARLAVLDDEGVRRHPRGVPAAGC